MRDLRQAALVAAGMLLAAGGSAAAQEFSWTGFYAGVHGGGAWGDVSVLDNAADGIPPGPFAYTASGGFGGATVGFNWQSGSFVAGVEGDLGYMDLSGAGVIPSSHPGEHQDITLGGGFYGDLALRLGFDLGGTLVYAKGGGALYSGEAMQSTTVDGYAPTGSESFTGWTVGAGVEHAFNAQMSVKIEYLHFDFGTAEAYQTSLVADPPTPAGYRFYNWSTVTADSLKAGLNWHF